MNQLTSYIDASIVYGTSEKEMRGLRENGGQGGKFFELALRGWPIGRDKI